MITYAGLARIVAGATGVAAAGLPPGHVAIRVLMRVLADLRTLADEGRTPEPADGHTPASSRAGRSIWQHDCGNVATGERGARTPRAGCTVCLNSGHWERLYVKLPHKTHRRNHPCQQNSRATTTASPSTPSPTTSGVARSSPA